MLKPGSVRHQGRNCHRSQYSPRDASEQELAQSRMAIATHDKEIDRSVHGMGENGAGHIDLGGCDLLELDPCAVARETARDVGAVQLVALCRLAGLHDNLDR